MHGNVAEWTADRFAAYPDGTHADYAGASEGTRRAIRGGSFLEEPERLRAASRAAGLPDARYAHVGFRLVRETTNLDDSRE